MNCAPIEVQCKLEIPSCDIPHFLSKLSILHTLDWLIFHKSWQMSKVLADCHSLVECHLFRLNSKIMIFEECPNLYFSWFIGGDGFKPTQKNGPHNVVFFFDWWLGVRYCYQQVKSLRASARKWGLYVKDLVAGPIMHWIFIISRISRISFGKAAMEERFVHTGKTVFFLTRH